MLAEQLLFLRVISREEYNNPQVLEAVTVRVTVSPWTLGSRSQSFVEAFLLLLNCSLLIGEIEA